MPTAAYVYTNTKKIVNIDVLTKLYSLGLYRGGDNTRTARVLYLHTNWVVREKQIKVLPRLSPLFEQKIVQRTISLFRTIGEQRKGPQGAHRPHESRTWFCHPIAR